VSPKPQLADVVTDNSVDPGSPIETVTKFLNAMQEGDVEAAISFVSDDIVYTNVSLPTIRGKERFSRGARAFYRYHLGFQVVVHRIAASGSSVLTERTDALILGPFRMQFWVCGVFEVENQQVTLWRDYFDWRNTTLATLRGLFGVIVPSLRAKFSDAQ
jgi:limonene-1,2-epoxide hydrolase